MNVLASDTFIRADESPLSDNGNWFVYNGTTTFPTVTGNKCQSSTNTGTGTAIWTGSNWSQDQASQVTLQAIQSGGEVRAIARGTLINASASYYFSQALGIGASQSVKLFKVIAGVFTQLGTTQTFTLNAGDVLECWAVGTSISLKINGSTIIGPIADSAIAFGSPGFAVGANGNASLTTITKWNGLGTAGIWNKLGTIIYNPTTDDSGTVFGGTSNGDVLYDTNPQLISANPDGKVFKMWFMVKNDYVYAEANNAQGPWTRKSPVLLTNSGLGKIYKSGSTYYHYVVSPPTGAPTAVKAYTSPDGVTLTLQNATALIIGGVGQFDHTSVQYLKPFYFDGTTYFATYSGTSGAVVGMGIATSTDLLHWTNGVSALITGGNTGGGPGPVQANNGIFYVLTGVQPSALLPVGIGISSSRDLITWSPVKQILFPTQLNEGSAAPSSEGMGPAVAIEAAGQTYLFYTGTNNALGTHYRQMAAVANYPLATALAGDGGLVSYSSSSAVTVSDNFLRPNETPLSDGGSWATVSGVGTPYFPSDLVSHLAVARNTASASNMQWIGTSVGNNHYSEVTLGTHSASSVSIFGANTRVTTTTFYQMNFNKDGSWVLRAIYAGAVVEQLQSGVAGTLPANVIGTVLRLIASGSAIFVYVNGALVTTAFDSTILTGTVGIELYDGSTPTSTGLSLWAGGTATVVPVFPPVPPTAGAGDLRYRLTFGF